MKNIEELKAQQKKIETEINEMNLLLANKKGDLRLVKMDIWQSTMGINIGDDGLFDDRKIGVIRAKLTAIDTRRTNSEGIVTLYKKDGKIGERTKSYELTNLRKA